MAPTNDNRARVRIGGVGAASALLAAVLYAPVLSEPRANGIDPVVHSTVAGSIADDNPATTTNGEVLIFQEDFSTGGAGFYNYVVDDGTRNCIPGEAKPGAADYTRAGCREFLPWVSGHIESRSPYWVDPNHKFDAATPYPGIGYLNIVGFVWHGDLPLNLTNVRVSFKLLLAPGFDFKGGHLSFWFQSGCVSKPGYTCAFSFADYILDVPIESRVTPGQWSELTLIPQENEWRCLGAQSETQYGYGCMPIADALANAENIGFMIVPVPADPAGANSVQASIRIDDVQIIRPMIEHVRWTGLTGATASSATLVRAPGSGWTAGAISNKAIESGDGFAQFTAVETSSTRVFGLARRDSVPGYEDIDFGIAVTAASEVQVYELGALRGSFGSYATGDRLRVEIQSGILRYRRNGVLLYTSNVAPSYPLRAHGALGSSGATIDSALIAGRLAENVEWANGTGVSSNSNWLTRVAPTGSVAGAGSIQSIPLGDGFVDFEVNQINTARTIGLLSPTGSTSSEADIDFGIRLNANGTLQVLENGVVRGSFGGYAAGDRLRVAVESGVIHYRRNGSLLYTSVTSPEYPLGVYAVLSSAGASVADGMIRGAAEQVGWTNVQNVEAAPGVLRRESGMAWDAGASSTRAIQSGDGYVEFTVSGIGASGEVGLSRGDESLDPNEIDFGFTFQGADASITENGVLAAELGPYGAGDRFRIAVEGGVVCYVRNGTLLYTSAAAPTYPLLLDASLYSAAAALTEVVLSGHLEDSVASPLPPPPVVGVAGATVIEGDSGAPGASFTVSLSAPAGAPVSVSYYTADGTASAGQDYVAVSGSLTFAPGETSKSITIPVLGDIVEESNETFTLLLSTPVNGALSTGRGTGIIADNDALLSHAQRINVVGNTVTRVGATGWNAGATWTRAISSGDGFMEFTAAETDTSRIAGLTHRATTTTYDDLDFGLMLAEGAIGILESGTQVGSFGEYSSGDHFRVAVVGGVVRYWHNDRLLWTSTRGPLYPLRAAAALCETGATVQDVVIVTGLSNALWDGQPSQPIAWTNAFKVSADGNNVTKSSGVGWDAGAFSTGAILSGSGHMEFTATEDNTYRIAGLSKNDTNEDLSDIDFGILLTAEHQVIIYESGEFRGGVGNYVAGDRLRVSVESRTVRYWKNGTVLYTSTKPPSYPLAVDTSLFTSGSSVSAVTLGGNTGIDMAIWEELVGVTVTDTQIVKAGTIGWNAGVVSRKSISGGDGFAEFVASETNTYRIFGLGQRGSAVSFEDVDFGIMLGADGAIGIYEGGNYTGAFGRYATGDRFRVSIAGGVIVYWRNTTRMYTSARTPAYPLRAVAALFDTAATIHSIRLVRAIDAAVWNLQTSEDVAWKAVVGILASADSLSKTAPAGWNAGAVSTKMIASGDGYVDFTVTAASGYVVAGLSNDDTDQDFADVDFGLMTAEGQVLVYEAGQSRGSVGPYAEGDAFRVSVSDGVVRYWQNQRVIYTSTVPPVYPLLLDTAMFSTGTVVGQARIAGVLVTEPSGWNIVGQVSLTGSTVSKSGATIGWNAGSVSNKAVRAGDAFVDFVATQTNTHRIAGFTTLSFASRFEDLKFGVLLSAQGAALIYESGTAVRTVGAYAAGDRFRVSIAGGVVRYWRNEELIYTSTRLVTYPLRMATAFYTPGATIGSTRFILASDTSAWDAQTGETVAWTHVDGVSAPAGRLIKPGADGWNAGAVSTKLIGSGDGYVDFTASGALGYRIAGLSTHDTDHDFASVAFGILLTGEGYVFVSERGRARGPAGQYAGGDRFRVSVSDGIVRYWQNQQLIYTGTEPPVYPLLVDTALYSTGVSIDQAKLAGALQSDVTGWSPVTGVSVTATSVVKEAATGWNAGAVSKKVLLSGDGFVEFAVSETNSHRICGLTTRTVVTTFDDVDFGILLTDEGTIALYESESYVGPFGPYRPGDRLRVSLASGIVRYWRNDTLLYTSARLPSYPLRVGTAMFTTGATVTDLAFVIAHDNATWDGQNGRDVTWTNVSNATANGNSLSNTGSSGWNAGALSSTVISSGDGYMEFTATEADTYRAAGVSRGDTDQTFEDIDFALLLTAEGAVVIYEAGEYRGPFGSYGAGDRFRISVSLGVVRYWRNGAVLYNSTKPASYPLAVDTSLFSPGATITNVVIAGVAGGTP